jgi:DNA-binding NarL/FixJ family response regulator
VEGRGALSDSPTTVPSRAPSTPPALPPAALTRREREIAALVTQGLTDRDIATRLVISPRTVNVHVGHILAKLDVTNRAQIAAWVTTEDTTEDTTQGPGG